MFLTFNELSVQTPPSNDAIKEKDLVDNFVLFCKRVQESNVLDECIFPETLYSIDFGSGYGIANWFADAGVPLGHKQFFRRFLDKNRRFFNTSNIDGEFIVHIDNMDYKAEGAAFAVEHEHILFSLPTHDTWQRDAVSGQYSCLNSDANLITSTQDVTNLCTSLLTDDIRSFCNKELLNNISSGQDLWDNREKLYPNLVFCDSVRDQLYEDSEKYHIAAVMKKFNRLQEYFSSCDDTYDPNKLGIGARTESETVKTDPHMKAQRLFRMPNGIEEYFFDHISFRGKYSGGRIYFLPDNKNRLCYIGYVGQHLDTKKY